MTLLLDNAAVMASVDLAHMVELIEEGLSIEARGGVASVPRVNLPAGEKGFFRLMPAVIPELDLIGLKAFNSNPRLGVRYLVALWSVSEGELLALVDASYLTAARTGAVTAVAHRALTRGRGFAEVGVIGSGLEARTNLQAICAVTEVTRVRVFSPNAQRCSAFANEMTERLGIEVIAVDSAEAAADADTVLVATNTGIGTGVIALDARWLRSRGHVNTIGSTMPGLREVDASTFGLADLVVLDTRHAMSESEDLLRARSEGHWDEAKIVELADLVSGRVEPPNGNPELTVFKSVGTALQDVLAARAIYAEAVERGLGQRVDLLTEKAF
jgi:alanine dehydrogenase